MIDFLVLAILIVAAVLLAWSSVRFWRAKNSFLKWIGGASSVMLSAAAALAGVIMIAGLFRLSARDAPALDLTVARTPERIRRGRAISNSFCGECHSKTGILTGEYDLGSHFPVRIGSLVSSNLTPAGQLAGWSDGDIFRAIRNSIDKEGNWLVVMSYTNAGHLSDDDILSLIAYIRSVPAAGHRTRNPPDEINLLGLAMLGVGLLPEGRPVITNVISAPAKGPTQAYGEYILSYHDCRACHGAHLTGGVPGQFGPLGPDLTIVKGWTREQFVVTLRTGLDPNGHQLNDEMPWRPIGRMDDEELSAIYEYLTHLPDL